MTKLNKKLISTAIEIIIYLLIVFIIMFFLSSCVGKQVIKEKQLSELNREKLKNAHSIEWLKKLKTVKTTKSIIYLDNMNSTIITLEKLYKDKNIKQHGILLASQLYFRYRILGNFEDAIQSLGIINQIKDNNIVDNGFMLGYTTILSGFHQFKKALEFLNKSDNSNFRNSSVNALIDEMNYSIGNYTPYQKVLNNPVATNNKKAKYALLHNDFEKANDLYKHEILNYKDTDPYKFSWLQLQVGISYLRYGKLLEAKQLFSSAHLRFPEFYLVTEHLAETEFLLGNLISSKKLYQEVSSQTNNPEFYAQLAKVESKLGNKRLSKIALDKAQKGFDRLVNDYPMTIGDHAVDFYLENNQLNEAMVLAKNNFLNRKNIESYLLLINTAMVLGENKLACKTYQAALNLKVTPIELLQLEGGISICENNPITSH